MIKLTESMITRQIKMCLLRLGAEVIQTHGQIFNKIPSFAGLSDLLVCMDSIFIAIEVQYASNTGTTWQVTPLTNVSIPAGQYHLVQLAGGANGAPLPTPDTTGTIDMAIGTGKVALVNSTTALSDNGCPFDASVVDFVGYGTTTNCNEGGTNAPAPSNTTSDLRNVNGCNDTNNINADFTAGTPSPRNSASPANPCTTITVTNVTSSVPDTTFTTGDVIDIIITFSGQVNVTGSPTLLLETGAIDRPATYVSGAGTNALLFNYTVKAGDSSTDLDYAATNSLSDGTITGATGEAIFTLPSPGSAGSLGADEIEFIVFNGHTFGQQMVKISDSSNTILFCADLMPFVSHIPLPYIMGYDLQPLVILEEKKKYLKMALDENWKLFFGHDPEIAFATIKKFGEGYIVDEKFKSFE